MRAKDRVQALRTKAHQQQLVVLVWGPGDPGPSAPPELRKYWDKRNQIKDVLAAAYPNSEVLFSESDVLRDHTRDLNDLLTEELVHAAVADCIIVLDLSRGAHVEVDRFSDVPEIAAKMTVLLPERYAKNTGLVSHVHKKLFVQGFSDAELDRCDVATLKSVSIVETFAIKKLLQGLPYA
jgi:hypothetical protein